MLWRANKANKSASSANVSSALITVSQEHLADVIDDARLLGQVRYTESQDSGSKLLQKKYFIDLVALITFHVRSEFKVERARLLQIRRELYEATEMDEQAYEDCVREIYLK